MFCAVSPSRRLLEVDGPFQAVAVFRLAGEQE